MVTCRKTPGPLEVVMNSDLLQEWDSFLEPYFFKKPTSKNRTPFKIMKYVIMKYLSNGGIMCSRTYTENYELYRIWKQGVQGFHIVNTVKSPRPEINQKKIDDVKSLYYFLSEEDIDFINNEMLYN